MERERPDTCPCLFCRSFFNPRASDVQASGAHGDQNASAPDLQAGMTQMAAHSHNAKAPLSTLRCEPHMMCLSIPRPFRTNLVRSIFAPNAN